MAIKKEYGDWVIKVVGEAGSVKLDQEKQDKKKAFLEQQRGELLEPDALNALAEAMNFMVQITDKKGKTIVEHAVLVVIDPASQRSGTTGGIGHRHRHGGLIATIQSQLG